MTDLWKIEKTVTISSSHQLKCGECANLHGHNWKITVRCSGSELDRDGMIIDFSQIKFICKCYDHKHLNDMEVFSKGLQPTAEHLAMVICHSTPFCDSVTVWECENSKVTYERIYEDIHRGNGRPAEDRDVKEV